MTDDDLPTLRDTKIAYYAGEVARLRQSERIFRENTPMRRFICISKKQALDRLRFYQNEVPPCIS